MTDVLVLETGVVAAVRYVRTQEGAARYGVPVGSRIEVNERGEVVRLGKTAEPSSRQTRPAEKTKFVPSVPGQKAKIPTAGKRKVFNGGLTQSSASALTNRSGISDLIMISGQQLAAMAKIRRSQSLSEGDKASLRGMIEQAYRAAVDEFGKKEDDDKKSSGGKKERSAAQKAATKKAQKASSRSTSSKKKAAQKKAQAAATKASALLRGLRAAYRELGGDPSKLAKPNLKI